MIKKYFSRDFLLIVAVGAFALASASGMLSPARIDRAAENITSTTEALPRLLNALNRMFDSNGPLIIFALGVYAYVKRKMAIKDAAQSNAAEESKAKLELERLEALNNQLRIKKELLERQMRRE